VTATDLSTDATAALVQVFIAQRYERLVRIGSRFWMVSGVDVNFGLFRGLEINIESLRTLVAGGIAFATPDDAAAPSAKDGTFFLLHDKPQNEWLEWRPKIPVAPAS
jgi:paraquat-inducible protein B